MVVMLDDCSEFDREADDTVTLKLSALKCFTMDGLTLEITVIFELYLLP